MKLTTPEISWHSKKPVLSVDFCKIGTTMKFASAGADNDVKIWSVVFSEDGNAKVEFLANLSRHNKAVNVVRFSPNEEVLASAGDDCFVILWKLNPNQEQSAQQMKDCNDDDIENIETWTSSKVLRGHIEDIYDLAWSPDGTQLISGSVDNSAIIWDVVKGVKLVILNDHKHYVQGVCWDPLGQYVVTNSSDRSCRLYSPQSYRCCYNINKLSNTANIKIPEGGELKQLKMFHDETMLSFFRRPTFTPDGSLLIVPAGRIDMSNKVLNTTYVFTRGSPNKPVLYLPNPKKPTVAVRCCPILFNLKTKGKESDKENDQDNMPSLFKIPYRMVFAIASLNSVLLYDTQHAVPFGYISNIHYSGISDITWSNDGLVLVVSSTDGYCSLVKFQKGELGHPYQMTVKEVLEKPLMVNPPANTSNITNTGTNMETSDSTGKPMKKVVLTPVQKMEVDEYPVLADNEAVIKKMDMPLVRKFAVPVSQLPQSHTSSKPVNKITPRRVQLTPVTAPCEAGSQATVKQVPCLQASQTTFKPVENMEIDSICVMKPEQIQSGLITGLAINEVPTVMEMKQNATVQSSQPKRRIQLVTLSSSSAHTSNQLVNKPQLQSQPLVNQKVTMTTTCRQGVSGDVTGLENQTAERKMSNMGVGQPRRVPLVSVPTKQAVATAQVHRQHEGPRRVPLTAVQTAAQPSCAATSPVNPSSNVTRETATPKMVTMVMPQQAPPIFGSPNLTVTNIKPRSHALSSQTSVQSSHISGQRVTSSSKHGIDCEIISVGTSQNLEAHGIVGTDLSRIRKPIPLEPVVIVLD